MAPWRYNWEEKKSADINLLFHLSKSSTKKLNPFGRMMSIVFMYFSYSLLLVQFLLPLQQNCGSVEKEKMWLSESQKTSVELQGVMGGGRGVRRKRRGVTDIRWYTCDEITQCETTIILMKNMTRLWVKTCIEGRFLAVLTVNCFMISNYTAIFPVSTRWADNSDMLIQSLREVTQRKLLVNGNEWL